MVAAMNRYVIAAATMWGIAFGTLAYRYGVLPLDWSSPWKLVVPGAAIGLAVGARQLFRDGSDDAEGRKRPALPILLGLGMVGALLAFGLSYLAFPTLTRASIAKREFPGFSVSLPSGDVIEDRHDYATGKLTMKNAGGVNGVAIVAWELGAGLTTDEMKLVGEMLSKAIGAGGTSSQTKLPGPDGKPVDTMLFDGDVSMMMTVLGCGGRHVIIATSGRNRASSLHERVIASFACKPDPAQEATAKMTFPLVLDLPGWYVMENEPDQMQITDGESALTLRAQEPNLKVDIAMIVEPMFKAAGVDAKITSRQGDRITITMSDGTDHMDGWVRLVPCPTASAFILALGGDAAKLDEVYKRVTTGRCLRPDEKPQEWPSAPADAPNSK
jgi:hypothetical protein